MGIVIDADAVLIGGNVITLDDKKPRAEAVAIKDGKFFWVGTSGEVKQTIGKETRIKILNGMTVVPGFIESHNHTLMFGLGLSAIDLTKVRSIGEILALVEERAKKQKEGTWITGVGYNQNELTEKRHPTRSLVLSGNWEITGLTSWGKKKHPSSNHSEPYWTTRSRSPSAPTAQW